MPLIRQTSFNIAPGTENQITVTPTTTYTTDGALNRFNPEERGCYTDDEIALKYLPRTSGYRYAIGNCLFEAAFENVLEQCKCYPGYNQGLIEDHNLNIKPCVGENLTCMKNIINRIGKFDGVNVNGALMKCRSSCQDQSNSMYVTTSAMPNERSFRYEESFCLLIPRLIEKCSGFKRRPLEKSFPNICTTLEPLRKLQVYEYCPGNRWKPNKELLNCTELSCTIEDVILQYGRRNLVLFHVMMKDPYSQRYQRDEKIPITSFIGNLGGLLGLWLGFSWISGAEVLFYVTKGILSLCKRTESASEPNHFNNGPNSNSFNKESELFEIKRTEIVGEPNHFKNGPNSNGFNKESEFFEIKRTKRVSEPSHFNNCPYSNRFEDEPELWEIRV